MKSAPLEHPEVYMGALHVLPGYQTVNQTERVTQMHINVV